MKTPVLATSVYIKEICCSSWPIAKTHPKSNKKPDALDHFKNDAELTRERVEAGVVMEASMMTPMTEQSFTNFPA